MVLESEFEVREKSVDNALANWYRSADRAAHPHPKKLKVECSIDEDVVQWLKGKVREDEEYPMYINHYLKKIMAEEHR